MVVNGTYDVMSSNKRHPYDHTSHFALYWAFFSGLTRLRISGALYPLIPTCERSVVCCVTVLLQMLKSPILTHQEGPALTTKMFAGLISRFPIGAWFEYRLVLDSQPVLYRPPSCLCLYTWKSRRKERTPLQERFSRVSHTTSRTRQTCGGTQAVTETSRRQALFCNQPLDILYAACAIFSGLCS